MKEKSLPRTPVVVRFCFSNEPRQRPQGLPGLCNPHSRTESCSTPHIRFCKQSPPPDLPHLRNTLYTMPLVPSWRVSPSQTLEPIEQIKAADRKPPIPPSNPEVTPENAEAFPAKGQWLRFYPFPEGLNWGGSRQATVMQQWSFASSVLNICKQGSQPSPGSFCWPAKPSLVLFFKLCVNIWCKFHYPGIPHSVPRNCWGIRGFVNINIFHAFVQLHLSWRFAFGKMCKIWLCRYSTCCTSAVSFSFISKKYPLPNLLFRCWTVPIHLPGAERKGESHVLHHTQKAA